MPYVAKGGMLAWLSYDLTKIAGDILDGRAPIAELIVGMALSWLFVSVIRRPHPLIARCDTRAIAIVACSMLAVPATIWWVSAEATDTTVGWMLLVCSAVLFCWASICLGYRFTALPAAIGLCG